MEEIIKGFNEEKNILVKTLCNLDNYNYSGTTEKVKKINERLAIVDSKIEDIKKLLLATPTQ
jgi:hypothetical protein